jgi:lipid-A-disaccharide synthase
LLLLPGSREGELRRHLPLMRQVAERLASQPQVDGFIVPTPPRLERRVASEVASWPIRANVITTEEAKLAAFEAAIAAVAVTGTVTLELALAGVPMVTTYVADKGQARRWLKYRTKWASLPNAILDRRVVPEVLGIERNPDAIAAELTRLVADGGAGQLAGFAELRSLMEMGAPDAPLCDPASRVLAQVRRQRSAIAT